ncbi:hypothetical protein AX14_001052 [Amanita brunnescens Koide BX004]|nr:hypothetical protein AX14_001052 [Amanita brunnescens Koide BX004]
MANEPPSAPAISQVRHGGTSTTGSKSDDSIKPNAIEPAGHGGTSTPNSEATEHQSKPDSGEPEEQPRPSKSDTASLEAPAPTKGQSLCSKVKCLYSKTKNIFHNLTHPGGFIAYHAALAVSHAMGGDQW